MSRILRPITLVAVVAALLSPPFGARGMAEIRGRREEGRWWQHGDIRRFHEGDLEQWRAGRWVHGRHVGRLGWWWVVGGVWYFYPAPVYPYPDPYLPPTVMASPLPPGQPPAQYWYYCPSLKAYYPYVPNCPEAWMQVVPQAPPQP
jgi:hypothetical protein